MKLHHKGIAVSDLNKVKQKYQNLGYEVINETYDEIQNAELVLMKKREDVIEVIYSSETESPVYNLCQKAEETTYHKCYQINNIQNSIEELKKQGYIIISEIVDAKLFQGKICFMYSKKEGVIELYEIRI